VVLAGATGGGGGWKWLAVAARHMGSNSRMHGQQNDIGKKKKKYGFFSCFFFFFWVDD